MTQMQEFDRMHLEAQARRNEKEAKDEDEDDGAGQDGCRLARGQEQRHEEEQVASNPISTGRSQEESLLPSDQGSVPEQQINAAPKQPRVIDKLLSELAVAQDDDFGELAVVGGDIQSSLEKVVRMTCDW